MSDLVAFLRARIDEDEATATATCGVFSAEWRLDLKPPRQHVMAGATPVASGAISALAHIARHDPARVLREVAADRKLLAALKANPDPEQDPRYDPVDPAYGYSAGMHAALLFAVKIRAERFSDHPDYDQEWRP